MVRSRVEVAPGQQGQVQGCKGERAEGTWAPVVLRGPQPSRHPTPPHSGPSDDKDRVRAAGKAWPVGGRAGVHRQSSPPEHPLPRPVSSLQRKREGAFSGSVPHGHTYHLDLSLFPRCHLSVEGMKFASPPAPLCPTSSGTSVAP